MMPAPLATAAVVGWIGRKPPEGVKCNKPSGICGYLDCAGESRCLERLRTKPSSQSAASSPAAFRRPP
jgi:hypothetical protein